ncbi:MAG: hypothetical protein KatS3mg096_440 [Candidatus Parcubacteria bacterium]|nr:MAG: hypothetical protein KatS3mg096_440 [Candidatus Parcubacteria bacterium]
MAKKIIIGTNLILDIINVDSAVLSKRKNILDLLKKLIKETKSTPVSKPFIKKIKSPKYPYEGYSVIQIIQESHIAIHTWPEYNYLAIDIFSCKKINENKIIFILKKIFSKNTRIKVKIYQRIAEY